MFNGVVAPLVFDSTYEYQVVLLAALALLPWASIGSMAEGVKKRRARLVRWGLPAASVVYVLAVGLGSSWIAGAFAYGNVMVFGAIILGPAVLTYLAWRDGLAGVLVASVPIAASVYNAATDPSLKLRERTFYGVHRVVDIVAPRAGGGVVGVRKLMHGTTNHGVQFLDPALETKPLGYYHFNGPCGAAMDAVKAGHPGGARMGVLGLGAGAISSHGRGVDEMVFFEIDPMVAWIAEDSGFFTYLEKARASLSVELGDGRLLLERARERGAPVYDILVMDAFSSDSIPVHLVTREAVGVYFDMLDDEGVLLVHISNRHLDLHPLIFELGADAGAYVLINRDEEIPEEEQTTRLSSVWMALVKDPEMAQSMLDNGFSRMLEPAFEVRVWTDQYSNLLSVIREGGAGGGGGM